MAVAGHRHSYRHQGPGGQDGQAGSRHREEVQEGGLRPGLQDRLQWDHGELAASLQVSAYLQS